MAKGHYSMEWGGFTSIQLAHELGVANLPIMEKILEEGCLTGIAWVRDDAGKKIWYINRPEIENMVKLVKKITSQKELVASTGTKVRKLPKNAVERTCPCDVETVGVKFSTVGVQGLIKKLFSRIHSDPTRSFFRNIERFQKMTGEPCLFVDRVNDKIWIYKKDEEELKKVGERGRRRLSF